MIGTLNPMATQVGLNHAVSGNMRIFGITPGGDKDLFEETSKGLYWHSDRLHLILPIAVLVLALN